MGGEKIFGMESAISSRGSPPRGRGKDVTFKPQHLNTGITPAWAGKSAPLSVWLYLVGDHPRVGGEKVCIKGVAFLVGGITPAWAGKSLRHSLTAYILWDHPRVGGEKHLQGTAPRVRLGSPPRGRGKVFEALQPLATWGITPAWAGKSWSLPSS